jgi:hypothetical protein
MSEWEGVNYTTRRLRVPGGWLYKTWNEGRFWGTRTIAPGTLCVNFVPAEGSAPPPGRAEKTEDASAAVSSTGAALSARISPEVSCCNRKPYAPHTHGGPATEEGP